MLHLISGNKADRKKFAQSIASGKNLSPQFIYGDDIGEEGINSFVNTHTGLFGDIEMFVIDSYARDIRKEFLLDYSASANIIIFSEDSTTKPVRALFEKSGAEITEFEKEAKSTEVKFNVFSLTDAFGARDKKNLWLLFTEAIKKSSPEEIHGILFWQIKNMFLVKTSTTNPGLNSFVYQKNQGFAQKFSLAELHRYAQNMLTMFHKRDTYSTLELELERFILSL